MKVVEFIKYLFKELFEVNHLMLDMINELENMDDSKIEKLSKALEKGLKRIK